MKNVTMKDVAKHTGFSISTVSHVINKTRNVESTTRRKIIKAMQELNYVPNTLIRNINKTADRTIGAIIADIREDFYTELVTALEARAMERGYSLLLCDSQESLDKEQFHLNTMISKGVSGIIMAPVDTTEKHESLTETNIPTVLVDRYNEHLSADFVGIDNARSAEAATRLLIDNGCKNICFLGHHDKIYTMVERISGYRYALMSAGLGDKEIVQEIEYFQDGSKKGLNPNELLSFLKKHKQIDGIICGTSSICFEAVSAFQNMKRAVPRDIQVVTYDDNKWFDFLNIPITSIIQPTGEIASEAIDMVVDRIEKPSSIKRKIYLDYSIKER
ncbi:LacI family DNA-binding transcriptional regulator [Coraliomargarita parva]|uniref:LacI family DNA-binding transcriptional regulator n=1 Tax=Coraliomargarita parva TaxID=3014050 RepID=UPI0022B33B49|nr:LacI family DNA-binding transcriptional regulator [Coraliomargarita parva]